MRTIRSAIQCFILTLSVVTVAVLHAATGGPLPVAFGTITSTSIPTHVTIGIPYVVRGGYGTQICVSSRSGWLFPPSVTSAEWLGREISGSSQEVQAYTPFTVRHGHAAQICVSTRAGILRPPLDVQLEPIASALTRILRTFVSSSFLSSWLVRVERTHLHD